MPDDVAAEKIKALEALGAAVERVRPASIVDKKQVLVPFFLPLHNAHHASQYVNLAREKAKAFGKESPVSRPHLVASTSQLVVATRDEDGGDDLPRGYFADQFEVRLHPFVTANMY
jgi:cysteine synthase